MKSDVSPEFLRHFRFSRDEVYSLFRDLFYTCIDKYGYEIASAGFSRFVNFDFDLTVRLLPSECDEIAFPSVHAPVGDIPVKP